MQEKKLLNEYDSTKKMLNTLRKINNVIFDKNMNYIGDLTKIKENEYRYEFSDEI